MLSGVQRLDLQVFGAEASAGTQNSNAGKIRRSRGPRTILKAAAPRYRPTIIYTDVRNVDLAAV